MYSLLIQFGKHLPNRISFDTIYYVTYTVATNKLEYTLFIQGKNICLLQI
jgi:hypothetical protein